MLLLRFLIGDAEAIRTVAGGRWSWAVGLLMLLSAGLARDYDREDLLAEPWHLLLPFAASTALVLVLFAFIRQMKDWDGCRPGGRHVLALLTAVWWMAPMAWLYAIPWERMLESDAALRMQILTLQIISVWRVILAGRIVHVLFGGFWLRSYALVTAVACTCMFIALTQFGPSLLVFMGRMSGEPWEERLMHAKLGGMLICFIAGVIAWMIGMTSPLLPGSKRPVPDLDTRQLPWVPAITVVMAVIISISVMSVDTQAKQRLATRVDRAWRESRTVDAMTIMIPLDRHDLPSYWHPVPRWLDESAWRSAAQTAIQEGARPWLRDMLLHRIRCVVSQTSSTHIIWKSSGDSDLVRGLAMDLPRDGHAYWQSLVRIMEQPAPAPSP